MLVNRSAKKSERGIITFLTASALVFVILPFLGLAIDGGVAYAVKAKLQTAVDGAAIAAGRSLARGIDLPSQEAAATDTATRFYHANFPDNYLNVTPVTDPTVTFPAAPAKTVIVNIAGSVQVPMFFMRVLNWNAMTVAAVGQVTRRDVNVVLVIDRSGSLEESGSCQAVASAAKSFVDSFVPGRDQLGLVSFGTDYRVDFAPSVNFATGSPNMSTSLSSLYCYGYTNAAAAFWTAYQQIVTLNDTGSMNVLLFFTDGMPNALTFGMNGANDYRLTRKTSATGAFGAGAGPSPAYTLGSYSTNNASPCTSGGPFSGVLSYAAGLYKKDSTVFPITPADDAKKIGSTEGNPASSNCAFDALFNTAATIYRDANGVAIAGPGIPTVFDVAYLPRQDIMGNYLDSGYAGSGAPLASVNRYTTGPYNGQLRSDDVVRGCCNIGVDDTITNAGINALDNAANRARADAVTKNLGLTIYTIGLGNAPGGVNNTLLLRVANDKDSNLGANSYTPGMYILAADTSQLNQAFNQIASEVLRLSR
jgi:hypothetical protein